MPGKGHPPGPDVQRAGSEPGAHDRSENGSEKTLNADTAQKIAAYLGTTVGALLGSEDVLDQVDVAFYGEYKELTEEQKETVRDMVRLMRARQTGQEK